MGLRLGIAIGFAIGYVMGSKAGRERYEQIRSWTQSVTSSQPAQQIGTEVRGVASRAGSALESKATEQVTKVTGRIRNKPDVPSNGPRTPPPG